MHSHAERGNDHFQAKKNPLIFISGFFISAAGRSKILQPPHLISWRLVGMTLLQSLHHRPDQLVADHKFNLPFLNLLDLPRFPNERLTAIQWAKLTEAEHLPGAMVVRADPSAAGGEYGTFHVFDMTGWNKKTELVHSA